MKHLIPAALGLLAILLPHPAFADTPNSARENQVQAEIHSETHSETHSESATAQTKFNALEIVQQNPINSSVSLGRNSLTVQQTLKPIAAQLSQSVVEIVGPQKRLTLGTLVSSDGLVVAKHSELTEPLECKLPDGNKLAGKIVGIHLKNDLALIQLTVAEQDQKFTPIVWNFDEAKPGTLVVSVGARESVVGFGLVTVLPQTFAIEKNECADCVDLGATMSQFPTVQNVSTGDVHQTVSGLEVLRVYPRTVSESTGLLVGDLMQTINGVKLSDRNHLEGIARTLKVGQPLTIGVVRNGKTMELSTEIKSFAPRTLHDHWGGGPFSGHRFGFKTVIAHDSVVDPKHCGTPLCDLQGRVLGINVARSMRVATFAIPIKDVYSFAKYVRPDAKYQFETDK